MSYFIIWWWLYQFFFICFFSFEVSGASVKQKRCASRFFFWKKKKNCNLCGLVALFLVWIWLVVMVSDDLLRLEVSATVAPAWHPVVNEWSATEACHPLHVPVLKRHVKWLQDNVMKCSHSSLWFCIFVCVCWSSTCFHETFRWYCYIEVQYNYKPM